MNVGTSGGAGNRSQQLEFFARCAGGFEEVLGQELKTLHLRRVRPQVGGTIFFGSLADAYRACLWSRVATRIQLVVSRVSASDADALYRGVAGIAWEEHVPPHATIAVDAHGENPELRNTKFTALKVKDAVCDRLREARGVRPDVDSKDPDLSINVAVHPQKATVYLNLSGPSLHRRGYRQDGVQTEAPLKETLAAGILLDAGWPAMAEVGGCLVDPMCGSGTFAIEAAMIAAHIAPGLLRERWGFEGWMQHDRGLWEQARMQAEVERLWNEGAPRILAGDLDPQAVRIARSNAERAGVADMVRFYEGDAALLGRHIRALRGYRDAAGLLVANPPYGMRLLSDDELPEVNEAIAAAASALPRSWKASLVSPDMSIDTALGRVPYKVTACYNGPIQVWVRCYELASKPLEQQVVSLSGKQCQVRIAEPNSSQFVARLRKVAKERARWAAREGISCYRVYDADLPDYALSLDVYQGAGPNEGERHLVLTEHRRPSAIDQVRAARRLADAMVLACAALDVPARNMVVHAWPTERGASRDAVRGSRHFLTVGEAGCLFNLNLSRLDTTLPLEQRAMRDYIAACATGARVGALFATSGVSALRALHAGARSVTIVDGSKEWLEGVERTVRDNAEAAALKRCCMDAREWIRRESRAHHAYDLLICHAPDWLPAHDAGGADWDLARDGLSFVCQAGRVLARRGTLVLVHAQRDFDLDTDALRAAGLVVDDASECFSAHDFARSKSNVRCLVIKRV